jgi:hypothetical protein
VSQNPKQGLSNGGNLITEIRKHSNFMKKEEEEEGRRREGGGEGGGGF